MQARCLFERRSRKSTVTLLSLSIKNVEIPAFFARRRKERGEKNSPPFSVPLSQVKVPPHLEIRFIWIPSCLSGMNPIRFIVAVS